MAVSLAHRTTCARPRPPLTPNPPLFPSRAPLANQTLPFPSYTQPPQHPTPNRPSPRTQGKPPHRPTLQCRPGAWPRPVARLSIWQPPAPLLPSPSSASAAAAVDPETPPCIPEPARSRGSVPVIPVSRTHHVIPAPITSYPTPITSFPHHHVIPAPSHRIPHHHIVSRTITSFPHPSRRIPHHHVVSRPLPSFPRRRESPPTTYSPKYPLDNRQHAPYHTAPIDQNDIDIDPNQTPPKPHAARTRKPVRTHYAVDR